VPTDPPRSGALLVDLARHSGGAETRVVDTARGLAQAGVPVSVVCLIGSPLADALASAGVPASGVARSKWDPRLVPALRKLLLSRPDWVVDAHNAQSQLAVHLAGGPQRRGERRVATVHSEYDVSERRLLGVSVHEMVLRRSIRAGWGLVAVTTSVRADLERLGAGRSDVDVVWSGITPRTSPSMAQRRALRRDIGVGDGDFVVLSVGRLVTVKNVGMAVRAVALLHERLPRARLVVVGDGPERPALEQLARQQAGPPDLVRFLGRRDDVADLLASSDALTITSVTEGLPYVLLEAAAAGTPVVSTSVGAIPEAFGPSAAVLLPPRVETQPYGASILAGELLTLALRPELGQAVAARAAAVQHRRFHVESMIADTITAYGLAPLRASPTAPEARHEGTPEGVVSSP